MRLIGTAGYRWNVRAAAALVVVGAIAASVLTPLLPDRVWAGEPGESEGGGSVRAQELPRDLTFKSVWCPGADTPMIANCPAMVMSASYRLLGDRFDPRIQRRDVLTSASAPSQQAGGALLVPFRNPAPAFSRNILLTRDFGATPIQLEPHLAVDPKDPNHVVVAEIDYTLASVGVYTTYDGGETWEGPSQTRFLRDDRISAGDPSVGFDRQGNVILVDLSLGLEEVTVGRFTVPAEVSAVSVARSTDGGRNWSDPVSAARELPKPDLRPPDAEQRVRGQVNMPFIDKPWVNIGPNKNRPDQDTIYVTYTEFVEIQDILYLDEVPVFATTEVQTTIKMVRSEDGGKTWSAPIAVSPTVRRASGNAPGPGSGSVAVGFKRVVQGSEPRVTPDGTLYVSWIDSTDDDSQKGLAEVYVARSDDGGRKFNAPVRVAVVREPSFSPRTSDFRYWGTLFPKLAAGPNNEVYMVYGALNPAKPQDDGDIWFTRTFDQAATWSRPKRLSDDEGTSLQFFPAIAVDPKGTLHVMWGDTRDDAGKDLKYHIYYTQSQDRGETWGFDLKELNLHVGDTRVTDFPSNPNRGTPRGNFIGDYFSIAASEKDVYLIWADSRLAEFGGFNQKIGFARRRQIAAPEAFISPSSGPGGQEVTLQGFNLQPDLTVFIQVGGVVVASERTNTDGRFTSRLFMPVTGQGAQTIRVIDDSGNVASTSFFTEFGFGSIRDGQQALDKRLQTIGAAPSGIDPRLQAQLTALSKQVRDSGTPPWVILVAALGGAAIAGLLAAGLTALLVSRGKKGTSEPGG